MAHGGGGRVMRRLIERTFQPAFGHDAGRDSAVLAIGGGRLAFTTDSYVVRPRFFPGGDIGCLAVYGTVNDLAMSGAVPLYLSVGMVLEEGLPLEELDRIVKSMQAAADRCKVRVVTGDTKVVDRGKGDGIFINTSGIGAVAGGLEVGPHRVTAGDCVVVSGDLGRHGVAVMSVREGLGFETSLQSDCAPLHGLVAAMLEAGTVHCLRDLTRGGLASALNEIAMDAEMDIEVDEEAIPVHPTVAGACELLGLDPLYVANEGRLVGFVPEAEATRMVAAMREAPEGAGAAIVGQVTGPGGRVAMRGVLGSMRILDLLSGEQLPRIC
jgi:hydrogenase expression/formation protein HypE